MSWLAPKSISQAGEMMKLLASAAISTSRVAAQEWLRCTEQRPGQFASADDDGDEQSEQIA